MAAHRVERFVLTAIAVRRPCIDYHPLVRAEVALHRLRVDRHRERRTGLEVACAVRRNILGQRLVRSLPGL